ncbi:MAG: hypothetical protein AAFX90_21690 [Pseudomonadota bacterium]
MNAYLCWATEPDHLADLALECLSEDRGRASMFAPEDRHHRLAAYGLARRVLRDTGVAPFDSVIARLPSGQPFLVGMPEVSISLSHSALGAMVGIGDGVHIGVDLQEQQELQVWTDIADYFAPNEDLNAEGFLRRWVASEACAKSFGLGMPAIADAPLEMSKPACCNGLTWQGRAARDILTELVPGGCTAYAVSAGAAVSVGLR